jgi:dihydropteroate synthase
MAILNVTPDSFSDGGAWPCTEDALLRARACLAEGADIIDIGGESTRPGSQPVTLEEELDRVLPLVRAVVTEPGAVVSVDTSKPEVARASLEAGAHLINDVSGLENPRMREVLARYEAPVVVMHMQGIPSTMQEVPRYESVVSEIRIFLSERIRLAREAGLSRIMIDPGIGFGKTFAHNIEILRNLSSFSTVGHPLLLGTSRKRFLGDILDLPVSDRLEGNLASVAHAITQGVDIVRVHDVRETVRLVRVMDVLVRGVQKGN